MTAAPRADRLRVLVLGFGNPGRLDDGLGPALAALVEEAATPGVSVDSGYQLVVEDAAAIAGHDTVVFADASVNCPEPFRFSQVVPREDSSFTTHSVSPQALLALAARCFGGAGARGYLLEIRGYEFDGFGERLSAGAIRNLEAAAGFLLGVIASDSFEETARPAAAAPAAARA